MNQLDTGELIAEAAICALIAVRQQRDELAEALREITPLVLPMSPRLISSINKANAALAKIRTADQTGAQAK